MRIRHFESISHISQALWKELEAENFPFADYEFLKALEDSGSVGPGTGWQAHYVTLWRDESLIAASYCYFKSHSYGEFIFDWGWAEAAERAGISYYPKLVLAAPFTPATGPKLLIIPGEPWEVTAKLLMEALNDLNEKVYSIHSLFIPKDEIPIYQEQNFAIRHSHQFHWHNKDYLHFDDFLKRLKQKRAKEIRRERSSISQQGIQIRGLTGAQLKAEYADEAYAMYLRTIDKKWSQDYLTERFFKIVFETMKDRIVFFRAIGPEGEFIGSALCFKKGDSLYGRYWGACREVKNLHFELCYYQAIEYAISHKLNLVEAGAQGPQKVNRGFEPALTYSAHRMQHKELHQAVTDFVEQEKYALEQGLELAKDQLPFRSV